MGRKLYVAEAKGFTAPGRVRRRKKGELKNEDISQDVTENKYRKNVSVGVTHDVYENKRLILLYPECL